jgi:transcriptional regulator of heat shock response
VNSPVAEEQALVAQVLQGHLSHPEMDRQELRELRRFLRQPLVGASVRQLRKALQTYSSTNDVHVLIETVQELHQHQGAFSSNGASDKKPLYRIKREDLKLICYEYIYA